MCSKGVENYIKKMPGYGKYIELKKSGELHKIERILQIIPKLNKQQFEWQIKNQETFENYFEHHLSIKINHHTDTSKKDYYDLMDDMIYKWKLNDRLYLPIFFKNHISSNQVFRIFGEKYDYKYHKIINRTIFKKRINYQIDIDGNISENVIRMFKHYFVVKYNYDKQKKVKILKNL